MNANIRTIGGAIGAAVMASIVTASAAAGRRCRDESGYTAGFPLLAGATILAALAGLLIPRARAARDEHQVEQASMSHPAAALVPGATLVGDDPE